MTAKNTCIVFLYLYYLKLSVKYTVRGHENVEFSNFPALFTNVFKFFFHIMFLIPIKVDFEVSIFFSLQVYPAFSPRLFFLNNRLCLRYMSYWMHIRYNEMRSNHVWRDVSIQDKPITQ